MISSISMCLIASQVAGVAPISPKKTRTGGAHHLFDESPDRSLAEYRANRDQDQAGEPENPYSTKPEYWPGPNPETPILLYDPEVCNITN